MTSQSKLAICPYKAEARHERLFGEAKHKLIPFARMTNEQIIGLSITQAEHDAKNSKTGKALKALPKVLIGTCVAIAACARPGTLSKKLASGVATAGVFAGAHLVLEGSDKLSKKIKEKFGNDNKENKGNPYIRAAAKFAGSIAVLAFAFAGTKKGLDAFSKTNVGIKAKDLLEAVEKRIDKGKIAEKVDKFRGSYQKFIEKHPGLQKNVFNNIFPATILGYIAATLGLSTKLNNQAANSAINYIENLANVRTEARIGLGLIETAKDYVPMSDVQCDMLQEDSEREIETARQEIETTEEVKSKKAAETVKSEDVD